MTTSSSIPEGDFAPTVFARPIVRDSDGRTLQAATAMESIVDIDGKRYLTPAELLRAVDAVTKKLAAIRVHPVDASALYFDADSVRGLLAVCGRRAPRQSDLLVPSSNSDAARDDVRRCEAEMRPLIALAREARKKQVSAEKLTATLHAAPDPRLATRRFRSIEPELAEVNSESMALTPHGNTAVPKTYQAEHHYELGVHIAETDHDRLNIKATLIWAPKECALFTPEDLFVRRVSIAIPERRDMSLLLQGKLCDAEMRLVLAMTVEVSASGLEYSGTLVRIENAKAIRSQFRRWNAAQQAELDLDPDERPRTEVS